MESVKCTKDRGLLGVTPVVHLRGPVFKFRPRAWIYWFTWFYSGRTGRFQFSTSN